MVFISISLCSSFLLLLSSDKNSFYFLPENSKHLRITSVVEKNKTKRTQKAIKSRVNRVLFEFSICAATSTWDGFDFSFYDWTLNGVETQFFRRCCLKLQKVLSSDLLKFIFDEKLKKFIAKSKNCAME